MADIFISYAKKDRVSAAQIAGALEGCGWSVWWDRDLPFGRPFDQVIREELRAAGCVVALWTEHAAESAYVIGEARDALRLNKLISVFISPADLTYDLQSIHGLELGHWDGDTANSEYQRLVRGITALVGEPVKEGSRLQPPAVGIERTEAAEIPSETPPPAGRRVSDTEASNGGEIARSPVKDYWDKFAIVVPSVIAVVVIMAMGFFGWRYLGNTPASAPASAPVYNLNPFSVPGTTPGPGSDEGQAGCEEEGA